jgi:hypothetical protein
LAVIRPQNSSRCQGPALRERRRDARPPHCSFPAARCVEHKTEPARKHSQPGRSAPSGADCTSRHTCMSMYVCRCLQAAAERHERPMTSTASGKVQRGDERQGSTWARRLTVTKSKSLVDLVHARDQATRPRHCNPGGAFWFFVVLWRSLRRRQHCGQWYIVCAAAHPCMLMIRAYWAVAI